MLLLTGGKFQCVLVRHETMNHWLTLLTLCQALDNLVLVNKSSIIHLHKYDQYEPPAWASVETHYKH